MRIVPFMKGGRHKGFKVFGIRADSVSAALGLQNGDWVTRIQGRDIATVDDAYEAYAAARESDTVTIELSREGNSVQLRYRFTPDAPAS